MSDKVIIDLNKHLKRIDKSDGIKMEKDNLKTKIKDDIIGGIYRAGGKEWTYSDFKVWIADSEERIYNLEKYEMRVLHATIPRILAFWKTGHAKYFEKYLDEFMILVYWTMEYVKCLDKYLDEWIDTFIDEAFELVNRFDG